MEFFIKKNATLPKISIALMKDGRSDYHLMMSLLKTDKVFFSMIDVENKTPKITSKPASVFLSNSGSSEEYVISFQFSKKDTNKVGRYKGEFILIDTNNNVLVLNNENIFVSVIESFVQRNECCSQTVKVPIPTPTSSQIFPTPTPTSSQIFPTPTPTSTQLPSNDLLFVIIPDNDFNLELLFKSPTTFDISYNIIPNNDFHYDIINSEPIIGNFTIVVLPNQDLYYQILNQSPIFGQFMFDIIPNNDVDISILY